MEFIGIRPAWMEIDLQAIRSNIREIQAQIGQSSICAVVKANAYSHGAERIAAIAAEEGCRMLAVATCNEAVALRNSSKLPVLCLAHIEDEQIPAAVRNDITLTVFTYEMAEKINKEALSQQKKATVHIKIDTGMSRIGLLANEKGMADVKRICQLPMLNCEGLFTHFANADALDKSHTLGQISRFDDFCEELRQAGFEFEIYHACNSAGITDFPQAHFDMVRPGILLYGYYPSDFVNKKRLMLRPAMSVKMKISRVQRIEAGVSVGYGCKFTADSPRIIATLPVGYADGVPYAYAAGGEVLIAGKRAPLVGSVCMDQMMADVTDIPECKAGDEVVLIGRQGNEVITPEEIAEKCHTIKYEIITNLNNRLLPVYINE
ncbi:MAG: alanine racemase [Firmicutes bacterium]|nr:alanine racemase [Bacillota bacterium]